MKIETSKILCFLVCILFLFCLSAQAHAGAKKIEGKPGNDADIRLDALQIAWDNAVELKPGESHTFKLFIMECCYVPRYVNLPVKYSLDPKSGASIDPATGLLKIDMKVAHGSVFTVRADVDNGRKTVAAKVTVYTPEGNPLVGLWREESQLDCHSGRWVTPAQPIQELKFKASGRYSVTWTPFEIYQDYWGNYTFDPKSGRTVFKIEHGNQVPADFQGSGKIKFEDGKLVMKGMYLGTRSQGNDPGMPKRPCGHKFINVLSAAGK